MKPTQSSLEYVRLAWLIKTRTKNQKPCSTTKLLLVFLASRANGDGNSWYGYAAISKQTGLSIATINRATKHLKELGILAWDKGYKNQFEKKTNYYYLNLERMRELADRQEKEAADTHGEQSAGDQPLLVVSNVAFQVKPVDAQVQSVSTHDEQCVPLTVSNSTSQHDNQTDQLTDHIRTDQYKTDQYRTDQEKTVPVFCVCNEVGQEHMPAKAGTNIATVNHLVNIPERQHKLQGAEAPPPVAEPLPQGSPAAVLNALPYPPRKATQLTPRQLEHLNVLRHYQPDAVVQVQREAYLKRNEREGIDR